MLEKKNFFHELKNILKQNEKFVAEDGQILQAKVHASAMAMDKELLKLLLENESTREHFFTEVESNYIFDKSKFVWVLESRELLEDSYTSYKNKIGLTDSQDNLIAQKDDVSLVWPYKDCVLAGGQTKDEQKRDEIFYNETLAPDEVNQLLHPKVFTNAKKYTKDGERKIDRIEDTDNLIIKGNNLLALHSLKERYAGKVKLIYIDPPYNTGKDSFKYNDQFNRSSWLTFMKDRLSASKELLKDDGLIMVHIDNNEYAYLKVLMDEIYKEKNFITMLVWENKEGGGKSDSKFFTVKHEYILVYAKNIEETSINGVEISNKGRYSLSDKHFKTRGPYYLQKLGMGSIQYSKSLDYPITAPDGTEIRPSDNNNGNRACWRWSKDKLSWGLKNDYVVIKRDSKGIWTVYTKQYLNADNEGNIIKRTQRPLGVINDYSTTQSSKHMRELFGTALFKYSKPEGLMSWLIKVGSNEDDIILDFFMGSATTQTVAHKMNRRYIGIEQMDYINTVSVPRLQKVIEGEQGGISKDVEWQGGGSFVYCELKELNQKYVDKILQAKTDDELMNIRKGLFKTGFISHKVDPSDINENVKEYDNLFFDDKKKLLLELIDKNKLYVNYSDIDDEDMQVSEEEKEFTHSFYSR